MFMTPRITVRHHPVRHDSQRRGAHLAALTRLPQEAQAGDELVELLDLTEIKPVNEELAAAFNSRPTLVSGDLVSTQRTLSKCSFTRLRRTRWKRCYPRRRWTLAGRMLSLVFP